ncbi:MAG: acyl-CoA dehydrogenase family protein [Burkholderiales bacterium]|nr:acyl-CoA dehydrogenase family protein [Burkholderiales bacterium]
MKLENVDMPSMYVPDSYGRNLYRIDPQYERLLKLYLPQDLLQHLAPQFERLGGLAGARLDQLAGTADRNPPTLHQRTRNGGDIQSIEKHPAFEELERYAYSEFGLAAMSHRGGVLGWPKPMPPAAKYALTFLFVQAEFGLCCPVSMTDSLTRTLRKFGAPELLARYLPELTSVDMDALAQGAMFITEHGAGSDVGASVTTARPAGDGSWLLEGEKWFCSNPDAGFAMVLARPEGAPAGTKGLALFLLPRQLADGTPNRYRILRLKDKLGSRSMASGEIRLDGATAYLVGELGRGFVQMTDMINSSRLSNGVRAAGLMRRGLNEALFVARERLAFGRRLIDLPLMQRQLVKMMVWTEQARSMMFQTAAALERADAGDETGRGLTRIMTPLIKFRACRDARKVTGDAMEVRGGCGYVEEWAEARLVRDAHLGSIWEGTSNIVALDVLRSIRKSDTVTRLSAHWRRLLEEAELPRETRERYDAVLGRVAELASFAAATPREDLARQAASALYHATTAAAMAWEAQRSGDARRLLLAELVLRHRLGARDPLAREPDHAAQFEKLLSESSMSRSEIPGFS